MKAKKLTNEQLVKKLEVWAKYKERGDKRYDEETRNGKFSERVDYYMSKERDDSPDSWIRAILMVADERSL